MLALTKINSISGFFTNMPNELRFGKSTVEQKVFLLLLLHRLPSCLYAGVHLIHSCGEDFSFRRSEAGILIDLPRHES
jgi:hypothetical protein